MVVEASAWLEDNDWILELAADDPWIVGLVGHVDPNRESFASDIERLSENPLFRGIRLGGGWFEDIEAGSLMADIEALAKRELEHRPDLLRGEGTGSGGEILVAECGQGVWRRT